MVVAANLVVETRARSSTDKLDKLVLMAGLPAGIWEQVVPEAMVEAVYLEILVAVAVASLEMVRTVAQVVMEVLLL